MPSPQARHWCFTINNYTDDHVRNLRTVSEQCEYLVFGREVGEQGTPHLQGFVSFSKRKSLGPTKKLIGNEAHLECAKGSPAQASAYCKKDGDFEEFGTCPGGKGKRTDLEKVAKLVQEGTPVREIAKTHPSAILRYGSGVLRLRLYFPQERRGAPEVHVFWGRTGAGKTRRVWEFIKDDEIWSHPGDKWFDGYDGHRVVLFDDFDGGWFKLTYLLKLLDRYRFQVPVKCGFTWWEPTHIFITSNIDPNEWYPNARDEHKAALKRRFTNVVKFD